MINEKFRIIAESSGRDFLCDILKIEKESVRIRVHIDSSKHDCTRSIERFVCMLDNTSREKFTDLYPEYFI